MKNKGQALVEFIIILPILVIIMLGIIDFSMIFYNKNNLENTLDEVVSVFKKNQSKEEVLNFLNDDKIIFEYIKNEQKIEIILRSDYEIITPGLNLVLDNPFEIKVSRVIFDE